MASLAETEKRLAAVGTFPALALPSDLDGRRAAVATILREGAQGGEILFIRRAERTSDPWSGHMAFPGGRRQASDTSLLLTATRETREEIGLDLDARGHVLGRLPDVVPHSKMPEPLTVSAFVFALHEDAPLTLNHEVAETIWAPLDGVLRGDTATRFRWQRDGMDFELPAIDVHGHIVWGLTYRMIELLREALTPR